MKEPALFDRRPVLVAVAGPNGAGKTTFYHAHLEAAGLRFINADVLAADLALEAYAAARVADALRRELLKRKESFVFETVFSDPMGEKLGFLREAENAGYTVVLCFVGLSSPDLSEERIAMRVTQGGHDVPSEKVKSRFPRILANLRAAVRDLSHVLIYDNSDLRHPFRRIAVFERSLCVYRSKVLPSWIRSVIG